MIPVLLALAAGTLLGYILRRRQRILLVGERATSVAIFVLLFLLGLSVGANESILRGLHRLGVEALALSLAGMAGSVLLAFFLYHTLLRIEHREE
ncbi:MAG TPA: LysO family transporter [Candidatus Binatia bacterium]|jgi:hypothetical protein|nr:LysO family transporter [Candidatus Binatia bacterium]